MKHRILIAILTCAAAAAAEEIVVSASRDRSVAADMPANVSIISSENIVESADVSLVDVLRNLDGIRFRTTSGNSSQAEIVSRGFGENSHGRVLVLLDGRKLNHPDMSPINWHQVPLNNIERVEVLRGSQSVLYGDYALGGVINIVTKRGAPEPKLSFSAIAGSYGLNVQRVGGAGSMGPVNYSANLERNQSSGYRDRSAYLAWGGGASVGYDINEWNSATASLAYNRMNYEMPGLLSKEQMQENPRQSLYDDDSAESKYYSANLAYSSLLSDAFRFDMNLLYSRRDSAADMSSWWTYSDFIIDTCGATPRASFETELFGRDDTLLAGLDAYQDSLEAKRYSSAARVIEDVGADIKRRTLGGYLENKFSITDSLRLDLGARFERAGFDAAVGPVGIDEGKSYNASALSAALLYNLQDDSKLFARAGTVYRFPFVDELVSYAGFSDDFYGELEMEKGRSYEVGADVALPANLRAGLTLFLLDNRDEISWNEATFKNDNLDETRRAGAEARAGWEIPDICRLNAWYSFARAKFTAGDNDGCDVPLVPNHKLSLAADLLLPFDLILSAVFTHTGSQYFGGDNENVGDKLDDYALVDLALRWAPKACDSAELEMFFGVDNVFGKSYATSGYRGWSSDGYYPSPERSFKGGLSCKF